MNVLNKTKVAIVGSRKINDYEFVENEFFDLLKNLNLTKDNVMIISGGARGVDTIAQLIAKKYGIPILIFYPDYKKYGKKAPLVRNIKIVKEADYILAFPSKDSRGTKFVINEALRQNKRLIIRYKGD